MSSIISSSYTHSSCIDALSHHSTTSGSRQLKAPSIASQHPYPHSHSGIHHEPPQICKHCCTSFYPSSSCHHLDELIGICHAQQTSNVMILPPFFHFLAHVTSYALSSHATYPNAPIMCLQITELILTYVALICIVLFAHVFIWLLMAVLRLLITFL